MPSSLLGPLIQRSVRYVFPPHFNNEKTEVPCPSPQSWQVGTQTRVGMAPTSALKQRNLRASNSSHSHALGFIMDTWCVTRISLSSQQPLWPILSSILL